MMKNENKFQIAGLEITPGERWQGTLMIGGGEFVLPAAVLHGEKRKDRVLITALRAQGICGCGDSSGTGERIKNGKNHRNNSDRKSGLS